MDDILNRLMTGEISWNDAWKAKAASEGWQPNMYGSMKQVLKALRQINESNALEAEEAAIRAVNTLRVLGIVDKGALETAKVYGAFVHMHKITSGFNKWIFSVKCRDTSDDLTRDKDIIVVSYEKSNDAYRFIQDSSLREIKNPYGPHGDGEPDLY